MNKIYQKTFPGIKNAGFTLIELLVVVLIIGILAAVALPQYEIAVGKTKLQKTVVILQSLREATQSFILATGNPPFTIDSLDFGIPPGAELSEDKRSFTVANQLTCSLIGSTTYQIECTELTTGIKLSRAIGDGGIHSYYMSCISDDTQKARICHSLCGGSQHNGNTGLIIYRCYWWGSLN